MAASLSAAGMRPCSRPTEDPGTPVRTRCWCIFCAGLHGLRFGFFDHRIHNVGLAAQGDLFLQEAVDLLDFIFCHVAGDDGLAAGRQFVDDADVEVAVDRQRQRARNRRRGHHQHVGRRSFRPFSSSAWRCSTPKRCCSSTIARPRRLNSTSASSSACVPTTTCARPAAASFFSCTFSRAVRRAGHEDGHVIQLLEQLLEIEVVLRRENFSGRQHRHLIAVFDGDDRRPRPRPASCRCRRRPAAGGTWDAAPPYRARSRPARASARRWDGTAACALIRSRDAVGQGERIPGCRRALARFSSRPHSSQKNSSKIRRYCAGRAERVEHAQIGVRAAESAAHGWRSSGLAILAARECVRAADRPQRARCFRECDGCSVRRARVVTFPAAS